MRGLIQFIGTDGGRFALIKIGAAGQYKVATENDVGRRVVNALGGDTNPTAAEQWYYRLPYLPPPSWPLAPASGQWINNAVRRASNAAQNAVNEAAGRASADQALNFGAALSGY